MPFAVHSMWTVRPDRLFSILTAFAITFAVFIVIVVVADLLLARPIPRQVPALI